jgi:hypothetical protein
MDPETIWHNLGGGAIVAAALTLIRMLFDYVMRRSERELDHAERRRGRQRTTAEARLERVLQDRLAEADRRLERCELELEAERARRAGLEAEHASLLRQHRLVLEQLRDDAPAA